MCLCSYVATLKQQKKTRKLWEDNGMTLNTTMREMIWNDLHEIM